MKSLFNQYFTLLNKAEIPYAITGRTENYPEDIHSDIDIVIPKDRVNDFLGFMHKLENEKLNWIQTISHEATAYYFVVTLSCGSNHFLIKPDVCTDYFRNGALFLEANYLLENRVLNPKGFYVMAPEKEFIYYLLKKIDKGTISAEQFQHLADQWKENPTACLMASTPFFSKPNQLLLQQIFDANDEPLLVKSISALKKDLHNNLKFNGIHFLDRIKNRMSRIVKSTGLVVAFMGPDGSGKTTIINGVKESLTEAFRQNKQYHLFPKEGKEVAPTTDPHNQIPRGYLGSIAKLFYSLGLYVFGYWTKVYPLKIKSTLVIFDRYYHDILVDPKRYRHGGEKFWVKLVGYFVPKPDVWLLLDVPATVIQQRKAEVTPEECERQVIAYRKLFEKLDNAFIINANQTPEQVIYDTEEVLIQYLKNRTTKRYANF